MPLSIWGSHIEDDPSSGPPLGGPLGRSLTRSFARASSPSQVEHEKGSYPALDVFAFVELLAETKEVRVANKTSI